MALFLGGKMDIYEIIDTLTEYHRNSLSVNLFSLTNTLKEIKKDNLGFFYVIEKNAIKITLSASLYISYIYVFYYTFAKKSSKNIIITNVEIIKESLF